MGNDLPAEAERLLSVAPDDFVAERKRLVGELRAAGRAEEAAVVASLRKPPPVVLAVNRAVRARPKIAKAAATAAGRVKKAQLNGDLGAYQSALVELEESLALLLDVALAHVAPAGKEPSEAIRHRIRDLLRNAVADDEACEQLARGVLQLKSRRPDSVPSPGRCRPVARRRPPHRPQMRALRSAGVSVSMNFEPNSHMRRRASERPNDRSRTRNASMRARFARWRRFAPGSGVPLKGRDR